MRRVKVGVLAAAVVGMLVLMPVNYGEDKAATPEYLGSKSCKMCHIKQHKSWSESKMAKAFEQLKPGVAKEAKEKAKLDPNKDYTKDPECLACHTVGFGKPGGYAIPKEGDAPDAMKEREGVGCESCHGPGSLYSPHMKEHKDYKLADVKAMGLIVPDEKSCQECHNDKSPFFDKAKWNFEEMKKTGSHEHVEMKQAH